MDELETFAYMLISASWSREIEAYLDPFYVGDIIELHLEEEDQAEFPEHLTTLDLDDIMSRIAPVQLTLGWDPRPYLAAYFQGAGILPRYVQKSSDGEASSPICYYEVLPAPGTPLPSITESVPLPQDKRRFEEVLSATLDLARSQGRGLLFIGGWGWSYAYDDMVIDYIKRNEPVLRAAGMLFLDRHP